MINGLKLAMSGDEVISLLNARIERIRAVIGIKLDAIAGDERPPRTDYVCRVLPIIRDHLLRGETYLIGQKDLEFGELLPDPPAAPSDTDLSERIRWVTHPVDVSARQVVGRSTD